MSVGNTILSQMGGTSLLSAMIGAKYFTAYKAASDSEYGQGMGGASFRFARPGRGKPNHVKIVLNGKDLYDVTFGSIHGTKYKVNDTFSDIYAENLKCLFENYTGLYLSL